MNNPPQISKLVICCCADYQKIAPNKIRELYAAAMQANVEIELCADLCYETIAHAKVLQRINSQKTAVAACYPRAVTALFSRIKTPTPLLIDLQHQTCAEILTMLGWQPAASTDIELPEYQHSWPAWYPAIDVERCNACATCVDYCLFGVYERQSQEIEVKFPHNCKTNCPACARICPQQAIIFPKHADAPINGGEGSSSSPPPIDPQKLFDENLYNKLARRRRQKRSKSPLKDG